MKKLECSVETYYEDGNSSDAELELSSEAVLEKIEWLSAGWSGSLRIGLGSVQIIVSLSEGRGAILADREGAYFDYSQGPTVAGWSSFVHGGQPAEHPMRHCLDLDTVKRVIAECIERDGIDENDPHWEAQRPTA